MQHFYHVDVCAVADVLHRYVFCKFQLRTCIMTANNAVLKEQSLRGVNLHDTLFAVLQADARSNIIVS